MRLAGARHVIEGEGSRASSSFSRVVVAEDSISGKMGERNRRQGFRQRDKSRKGTSKEREENEQIGLELILVAGLEGDTEL